jgi:hypothetical protein
VLMAQIILAFPLGVVTDSQVPDQVLGSFGSPLDGLELDVSGTSTLLSPVFEDGRNIRPSFWTDCLVRSLDMSCQRAFAVMGSQAVAMLSGNRCGEE